MSGCMQLHAHKLAENRASVYYVHKDTFNHPQGQTYCTHSAIYQ